MSIVCTPHLVECAAGWTAKKRLAPMTSAQRLKRVFAIDIPGDLTGGDPPSNTLFQSFDGEDPQGTWRQKVADVSMGDAGPPDERCILVDSNLSFF